MDALDILGTCDKLYSLDLRGNPIEKGLTAFSQSDEAGKGYREVVMYHTPNLKVLDGSHLHFTLVDASFIAEATTFVTLYLSKYGLEGGEDVSESVGRSSLQVPWQTPLGSPTPVQSDTSSSLTQTGMSFAGAPSALLRGRRGKAMSAPVFDNPRQLLMEVEEERGEQASSSQADNKVRKHRRSRKKMLTSSSLGVLPSSERKHRDVSNQSPSPTDPLHQEDDEGSEEGEATGLMEAWRASRPCSSDDALPSRHSNLELVASNWDLASPEVAQSPNTRSSRGMQGERFMPATSLSFEAETRPHSAHTSTPASAPSFLMMQGLGDSPSKGLEPSCDDIDLSLKSVQRQFSGQHRRRKHRGRGWQNGALDFNQGDKLFVAPDTSASSWSVDKANGVLKPCFNSKHSKNSIEEVEDEDSDSESQQVTRASLKARAQAMISPGTTPTVAQKSRPMSRVSRAFLASHDSDDDAGAVVSSVKSPNKAEEDDRNSGAPQAAGQLGFNLESSLQAIEQWTDISELSERKQKKLLQASNNKQREAALLSVKPHALLAPPPMAIPEATNDSVVRKSAVFRECQNKVDGGAGLSDEELVAMLQQPPKHVPALRTREAFRSFFSGFSTSRMKSLLEAACADEKKVEKRYNLVKDLLI